MHYFGSFFIYVFDWVFLEIPEKICIMGIFFSCPIGIKSLICTIRIEVINISQQKLWHSTTTVWDGHISSKNVCVVSEPTGRHCWQQGVPVNSLLSANSDAQIGSCLLTVKKWTTPCRLNSKSMMFWAVKHCWPEIDTTTHTLSLTCNVELATVIKIIHLYINTVSYALVFFCHKPNIHMLLPLLNSNSTTKCKEEKTVPNDNEPKRNIVGQVTRKETMRYTYSWNTYLYCSNTVDHWWVKKRGKNSFDKPRS